MAALHKAIMKNDIESKNRKGKRPMFNIFKKLFLKQEGTKEEPPGRTFNQIITSQYFDPDEAASGTEKKQGKIEQIAAYGLHPKFLRYRYGEDSREIESAYVVFQKETTSRGGSMVHVSELAFTVKSNDFKTFETLAGVSLEKDFRDLTHYLYTGEERRKESRNL